MLDVDVPGLDVMDRKLLRTVLDKFAGGPVGVENLAAAIGEERDTIEDVLEPFLIQQGFLQRTSRGRIATALSYRHFGLTPPAPGGAPISSRTAARLTLTRRTNLSLPAPRLLRGHRRRAASSTTPTTSSSWSARAPNGWRRWASSSRDARAAHGVVFVVHRAEIEYRLPARLGDRLDATLTLIELGRARMVALQQVWRGDERLLTDAA